MPKQTFWNLPAEKRAKLRAIALEEFARNDYATASVSRIVARAGIAKGSVYQYFEDKRELFLYLLDEAQRTLLAEVQQGQPAGSEGFFRTLRCQMSATVRAALVHPVEAQLVRRAYASPLPFHDELLERAQELRRQYLRSMVAEATARGELDRSVDPAVAAMILDAVISAIGPFLLDWLGLDRSEAAHADVSRFDVPEVERVFDEVIAILRHGLGAG